MAAAAAAAAAAARSLRLRPYGRFLLPGARPAPATVSAAPGRAGQAVVVPGAAARGQGRGVGAGGAGGSGGGPGPGAGRGRGGRGAGAAPPQLPLEPRRGPGGAGPRQPAAGVPGVPPGVLGLSQHGVRGLPQPGRRHAHRGRGQGAGAGGGGAGRAGRAGGAVPAPREGLRLLPQALRQRRGRARRQQRGAAPRPQLHRQRAPRGGGLHLLPADRLLRPPCGRDGARGAALQPLLPRAGHRHGPPHLQRDPGVRGRYPSHHVPDRQGRLHLPALGGRAGARPAQEDGAEADNDVGAAPLPPVVPEEAQVVGAEEQEDDLSPPPQLKRGGGD